MPAAQSRHQIYGETQERLAVIAGGAAGNLTVTGIRTVDKLINVLNLTDGGDLVAEFTISAANTINNTGGTSTAGDKLLVRYYDTPAGAA
jgi:hypothetical protein